MKKIFVVTLTIDVPVAAEDKKEAVKLARENAFSEWVVTTGTR